MTDTATTDPPTLLTSADVATRFGIARSTLQKWVHDGKIRPANQLHGLRGPFLFTPDEVARVEAGRDA